MSTPLSSQISLRSPSSRENEGSNYFASILLKKEKTLEDAYAIYEKIKGFSFFHEFCTDNLTKMDMPKLLNLCQGFKYETNKRGNFVYKQGDASNDKFYIILSGEVAIVNSQRLGDFGTTQTTVSLQTKSPMSQTFLTSTNSASKKSLVLSARGDSDKKIASLKEFASERKKALKRLEGIGKEETDENKTQPSSSTEVGKLKPINKLRAVYDAVKALRTMQKFLPTVKKPAESLNDLERRESTTVGTLQYLDDMEDEEQAGRKEFETFASSYGSVVQYLGVGESFGEQALKKNAPRQSSILCSANCEFLALEKQQFDDVFGRIEKEKEEFLKTVFPILTSFSSANYNFLVCCFKTERYSKGTYLINEGPLGKQKAKFYVIQAGECVLEKRILRELNNPYNLKHTVVSGYDNLQLTVLGKGSVIGEEIVQTDGEYEYSVKVISDTVLVQAITKKEFKLRFPQDFQEYVASVYETKKKHREDMYNNINKDNQTKIDQYKANNVYCIANASIANLTTKSAKQCFSRQMQRENKLTEVPMNNFFSNTTSPRNQTSYRENSLASVRSTFTCESMKETSPKSFRCTGFNSESKLTNSERKAKGDFVTQKIEFLSKIQTPRKQTQTDEETILEVTKMFADLQDEKDKKTYKIRLAAQMAKQHTRSERKPPQNDRKSDRTQRDIILNRLLNKREDIEYIHQGFANKLGNLELLDIPKVTCMTPVTPKSITQSTRSSFKFGAFSEINSSHNQKSQKDKPALLHPTSPSSVKVSDFEAKLDSMNELSTLECIVSSKPESKFPRNPVTSIGSWSFKTLKIRPETEKAANTKSIKEGLEIAGRSSTKHAIRIPPEIDFEARRFTSFFEQEKMLQERSSTMLNEIDNKKSPTSVRVVGKTELKGMYAHLNETKEWRTKVFKKPKRKGSAMKADTENLVIGPTH